ncbi:adenosylmethionine decarboxylase [Sagittula salina]|nr:adenosylmethionine decarboxylase [Sagittula salina]
MIAEFHGAADLLDAVAVRPVLRQAAEDAGAVVLEVRTHDFGARAGFTGVALLAESHISVHTWPEYGYAAIDVFMCGACDPRRCLPALERFFRPERTEVRVLARGGRP